MKHVFLLSIILIAGCAIQPVPRPAPTKFCGQGETVGCQPLTPGMKELAPPRGRSDDSRQQLMFYKEPEVIFKDEHTPGTCRSPFR